MKPRRGRRISDHTVLTLFLLFQLLAALTMLGIRRYERHVASAPSPAAPTWDGTTTLRCTTPTTLRDVTLDATARPAIVVEDGCHLVLERATLRGDELVVMRGTGTLRVLDSRLSGDRLIASEGAAELTVLGSTLEGSDLVTLHGVTKATIARSTLRVTGRGAVIAEGHGRVEVSDARLVLASEGPTAPLVDLRGQRVAQIDRLAIVVERAPHTGVELLATSDRAKLALWQPTLDVAAAAPRSAIVYLRHASAVGAAIQHGKVRAGGRPVRLTGRTDGILFASMDLGGSELLRR